jgi:hypothetical protein
MPSAVQSTGNRVSSVSVRSMPVAEVICRVKLACRSGTGLRLGRRVSTALTCRLAILDALSHLPDDIVTADQLHDCLARENINYPRNTVYKTMLRMSNAADSLIRVDGGFRVTTACAPTGNRNH